MIPSDHSQQHETRSYAIGYVAALVLTGIAFAAVRWPSFPMPTTLAIVFALALVQVLVHFRFFLPIGLKRSSREDLQLLPSSALIIMMMVSGTIVVLLNLRQRTM